MIQMSSRNNSVASRPIAPAATLSAPRRPALAVGVRRQREAVNVSFGSSRAIRWTASGSPLNVRGGNALGVKIQ